MKKIFNMMKKPLVILSMALFCVCCSSADKFNNEATIVFNVYYPNDTQTYTYTTNCTKDVRYFIDSYNGTNYIVLRIDGKMSSTKYIIKTTAPIRVLSFTVEENNNKPKLISNDN